MAFELYIPPCIADPQCDLHPPPFERPLRTQTDGPLVSIEEVPRGIQWNLPLVDPTEYFQPAGAKLAALTYKHLCGRDPEDGADVSGDLVLWDKYLNLIKHESRELLQVNILEIDDDNGEYANNALPFRIDAKDCTGKKVLAVPRCCQKRKGIQDCARVHDHVLERERWKLESQNAWG
ncbi:hypothetical protein LZ30DRAFT_808466 [Colletotrichum cereale]|nr:hypothetical protein LZ30DRAFT_808466 [Colletotrichum cereale]